MLLSICLEVLMSKCASRHDHEIFFIFTFIYFLSFDFPNLWSHV